MNGLKETLILRNYLLVKIFYNELITKSFLAKTFTPNVVWFMICASFFPKHFFAKEKPSEFLQQRIERIKSLSIDIVERVTKHDLKAEIKPRKNLLEFETRFLEGFQKSIKDGSNMSNEYLRKIIGSNVISSQPKLSYGLEDDEWILKTRNFVYQSYKDFQKKTSMEIEINKNPNINLFSKIELQDLVFLYEKSLCNTVLDNGVRIKELEERMSRIIENEDSCHQLVYDFNSSIVDMRVNFPEDEDFIHLLEKKQHEGKDLLKQASKGNMRFAGTKSPYKGHVSKSQKKVVVDDIMCFVCNEGDYTDDDLIVFCSVS